MSLSIVNGFVCRDCTDAARARLGQDPAAPAGQASRPGRVVVPTAAGEPASETEPRSPARPAEGTGLVLDRHA